MSKPDYEVTVKAKGTKYGRKVGAAWVNKAGGINVKLDAGLAVVGGADIDVTLWPPKEWGDKQPPADDFDDDIPFG